MGSNANLDLIIIINIVVFCTISVSIWTVHCSNVGEDLDDLIRTYAELLIPKLHTGSLNKITLPANLSGVNASVVTIRNSVFWRKGTNFSDFYIPSMIRTKPFSKRIALVYENFRNLSSKYFQIADHTFVSPVVGFSAYDASNPESLGEKLNLSMTGNDSITIRFDSYVTHDVKNKTSIKCVTFDGHNNTSGSSSEFSDMTRSYECATTSSSGHFVLVVLDRKTDSKMNWTRAWRWVVVAAAAVAGIFVLGLVGTVGVELVRRRRIREMERESEKSEMIRNVWIGGRSRMPAAAMVRTQPCIELHEDVPSSPAPL